MPEKLHETVSVFGVTALFRTPLVAVQGAGVVVPVTTGESVNVTGTALAMSPWLPSFGSWMTALRVNACDAFDPGEVTCTENGFDADGVTVASSFFTVSELAGFVTLKFVLTPVNCAVTVYGPAATGIPTLRVAVRVLPLTESAALPTLVAPMRKVTPVAGDWPRTDAGDIVAVSATTSLYCCVAGVTVNIDVVW